MKKTIQIIVLAVLCLNFKGYPQSIQHLKVGDKLPESLWKATHDAINNDRGKELIKLEAFKGELLIIDFWATWCSACIAGFSKVEQLQKEFPEQLKIVLVTAEPANKVVDFLSRRKDRGDELSLTTIIADTLLNKAFVHQLIPHYVWISADGTVLATTSALEINKEHIQSMLQNKQIKLEPKIDHDKSKPLFSDDYLPEQKLEQYSILLKGYIEGVGSSTTRRVKNGKNVGYLLTNSSLLHMYEHCFYNLDKEYSSVQLQLQVADSSLLIPEKSSLDPWEWYKQNGYSLDFIVPENAADHVNQLMIENLNQYSPFVATVAKRWRDCLVLVTKGKQFSHASSSGEPIDQFTDGKLKLKNKGMTALKSRLNNDLYFGYPVMDETGYKGNTTIEFTQPVSTLSELKRELSKFGLTLKNSKRIVAEYIIRDKQVSPVNKTVYKNLN